MSAPRTVIDSCHVPRFAVAPGAMLDGFLNAWARSYVVARSWPLASLHPPTLTEDARREIEEAVNRDLADAGRPERVDVFAEMGAGPMDLVLRWRQRETAPASAAPSPEEMAEAFRMKWERAPGVTPTVAMDLERLLIAERARAAAREQALAAGVERLRRIHRRAFILASSIPATVPLHESAAAMVRQLADMLDPEAPASK